MHRDFNNTHKTGWKRGQKVRLWLSGKWVTQTIIMKQWEFFDIAVTDVVKVALFIENSGTYWCRMNLHWYCLKPRLNWLRLHFPSSFA